MHLAPIVADFFELATPEIQTPAISWGQARFGGWKLVEDRRLRAQKKLQKSFSPQTRLLARADAVAGVPCMPRPCGGVDAAAASATDAAEKLAALQAEVETLFPGCESLSAAKNCVFGEGSASAEVVFVGEAPGAEEDRFGRPFVGPAGRKLDEIIAAMGFRREEVYICNILKARPPGNRNPLPDEVAMSLPWLQRQLSIIQPQIIVALGGPAAKTLLNTETGITRLRGRMSAWTDPETGRDVLVMPTFHPAYLLRKYTPEVRGQVWQDMKAVLAAMVESDTARDR